MTKHKKFSLFLVSVVIIHFLFIYAKSYPANTAEAIPASLNAAPVLHDTSVTGNSIVENQLALYTRINLDQLGLSQQAYEYAIKGFNYLLFSGKLNNDHIISIVDFSKASANKRLFVIDLKEEKVLFHTYVSHGRNSGREMAKDFSNEPESFKSSLGFYVTGGTYQGKHGFSMKLMGEERGINDNANSRAIVMHSAPYVSESFIRMQGFIGRSLGCPALPENIYKPIIEKIKNGSCLFLYSPNTYYAKHSTILKKVA